MLNSPILYSFSGMTVDKHLKQNIGVYTSLGHDLYVAGCEPNSESLQPAPGEVIVHIKATGICGSDVHFYKHGQYGPKLVMTEDLILGHESAGVVIKTHPSVSELQPGDRVAIEPGIACHKCDQCLAGRYNGCEDMKFNSCPGYHGLLRRYISHPAKLYHKIWEISYENGALLEPVSVGIAGVNQANIKLGDTVVVCGAGPVGLITATLAKCSGAAVMVMTDIDAERLRFAKKFIPSIKTVLVEREDEPEDIANEVIKSLGGIKANVCLECSGVESSVCAAIYSCEFGGVVQLIGAGRNFQTIPFMHLSVNEIQLNFQFRYVNTWPVGFRMLNAKMIDFSPLVTNKFPLERGDEAVQFVSESHQGVIKVMIVDED